MKHLYFLLLFLLTILAAAGQNRQSAVLRGSVVTGDNRAVSGASVLLTGTAFGTTSDAEGNFSIRAPAGSYRIRITFVGYEPAERPITLPAKDTLRVILKPGTGMLSEVTVSTGYQELPKERATGSFVKADRALLERSVSTDIIDRLRDVVPGLSFNNVGTRISIRGQSTIFSNADPLIVVDGFPYNQPIENLNPNDVESITVLKDAAAASIWGTRAGNGVIVISTKKGSFNRPVQITANANIRFGSRPDLFGLNRISTSDYIDIEKRLFSEGYFTTTETADGHPPLSPVTELLIAARDGKLTAAEANRRIDLLRTTDVRNDILKYLDRTSADQQYAFSLDGGTLNQRYYYSAGYDKNLDNLRGNGFDRVTLSGANTWNMLSRKLDLSLNMALTETGTDRNNPGTLTWNRGQQLYPYAALADASGNALAITKDYRQSFLQSAQQAGLLDWQYRPLDELHLADNRNRVTEYRINTGIKYRILPGLNAQVLYQYDHSSNSGRNIQGQDTYFTRNLINRFTQADAAGSLTRPIPPGGIADLDNSSSVNHDIRGQLNYETVIRSKHEISAIAGYEVQTLHVLDDTYRLYGYDPDHATAKAVDGVTSYTYYDNPLSGTAIPLNLNETDATDHYRSYYANAAYTYDRRFTLSGSGRLDQSNLFGVKTNQKGVPLYSAGFAWNIGHEIFYHSSLLPELKLRATYGYNGNINKTLSAFTTASYFNGSDSQTRLPYAYIVNPPNPELKWERVRNINLGLDFGFRNSRLTGSLEYFVKDGLDLIGQAGFPPSSGITVFTGNSADTKGHGLDMNLSSRNLTGKLAWNADFFISYITDRVTRYDRPAAAALYLTDSGLGSYPLQGRPLYAIYSYSWAGLDPATGDPRGYLNGAVSKDYNAILTTATPQTLVYNGPSRPPVFGALRNTLTYCGISLSANVSYKLGYYFRRNSVRYGNNYGLSSQNGDYAYRWQKPGDELSTIVPSLPQVTNIQRDDFYTYSSALVEKGDHIRLADLRLSYTAAKGLIPALGSAVLQCYLYATNVEIIWRANKYHLDPENPNSYPAQRTIAAGLRLNY